jgi:photoactive yellow protein
MSRELDAFSEISAAKLLAEVEQASPSELDELPFGVIRLDAAGNTSYFSRTEARQSGVGERNPIGKKFFTELAPCMGSPEFLQRVERARLAGTLDITFEQVGDFDDAERELRVRLISAAAGGVWIFIQRLRDVR